MNDYTVQLSDTHRVMMVLMSHGPGSRPKWRLEFMEADGMWRQQTAVLMGLREACRLGLLSDNPDRTYELGLVERLAQMVDNLVAELMERRRWDGVGIGSDLDELDTTTQDGSDRIGDLVANVEALLRIGSEHYFRTQSIESSLNRMLKMMGAE